MTSNFHAFTDGDAVASGLVRGIRIDDREIFFEYSYSWLGVNIDGRFDGKLHDGAQVKGGWRERSKDKIAGKTAWTGRATLTEIDEGGRRTLVGVWGGPKGKMTERWIVDVGKVR